MLDLLEKNIMTSSKWQLLPYFIVYLFHRSFEKSRKNNPMFEDFGFIFFFFFFQKYKILAVSSAVLKA